MIEGCHDTTNRIFDNYLEKPLDLHHFDEKIQFIN